MPRGLVRSASRRRRQRRDRAIRSARRRHLSDSSLSPRAPPPSPPHKPLSRDPVKMRGCSREPSWSRLVARLLGQGTRSGVDARGETRRRERLWGAMEAPLQRESPRRVPETTPPSSGPPPPANLGQQQQQQGKQQREEKRAALSKVRRGGGALVLQHQGQRAGRGRGGGGAGRRRGCERGQKGRLSVGRWEKTHWAD